jgi:hypothetical protein
VPVVRCRPLRRPRRLLTALALLVVLTGPVGCGDPGGTQQEVRPPTTPATAATASATPVDTRGRVERERAVRVLREWDARRSAALAAGDTAALRRLYVDASPLARQDVRVLRRYQERGVRLTSVSQQVASVRVRVSGRRVVEVGVVERLAVAGVRPVGSGAEPRTLATTRYVRRELRFVRSAGGWRLSSARAA